jgi:regulator of sigma E protease
MDLLQSLFSNLWSLFLVVLFFGGSIFVHELGHFLAARRRGVHVERFSIGFGPKIFSWRGKDGVEYRLSWLPLGGYVALPQLADMRGIEGESQADLAKLPPITYSTKVIVFAAGAVFNIIFAFLLACIVWVIGQPTSNSMLTTTVAEVVPTLKNEYGAEVPSPASLAGLKAGDTILKVDGKPVEWFGDITERLAFSTGWNKSGDRQTIFTIKRGEDVFDLALTPVLSGNDKLRKVGFSPVMKMIVGRVEPGSVAEKAGLRLDDEIVAINGQPVRNDFQLVTALRAKATGLLTITVKRGGKEETLSTTRATAATEPADIGIAYQSGIVFTHPSPTTQITDNVKKTFQTMGLLVNRRSDIGFSHMSGPIGIMRGFFDLAKEGLPFALWFTIVVNVNLAIFNLLPIPVLDGGHILFATLGKLRGRALPVDFIATTQSVFIVLLFSMILYVTFFDVRRMVRDGRIDKPAPAAAPAK